MQSPIVGRRLVMLAWLSAALLAMAIPAAAGAANPPIRFNVNIGLKGACVIVVTDANAPTDIRLRAADGTTKASGIVPSDDVFFCLPNGVAVEVGDRLWADDGTFARTFVVPNLSVVADRVNDTFHGTGPIQRTIKVGYTIGMFGDVQEQHGVRVDGSGNWSFDPNFDFGGGQDVSVVWKSPNGDRVNAGSVAAILIVTLGSPRFIGRTDEPFLDIVVDIDGAHDGVWNGASDSLGAFSGRFRRPNGTLVPVAAGDQIAAPSVALDLDWEVPDLQISADAPSDVVTGQCAGTLALIELYRTGHRRGNTFLQPGPNGEFDFDFRDVGGPGSNEANVKPGDSLRLACVLETGDRVLLRTTVP